MPYAEGTSTPVSRSRDELQRALEKAKAEEVGFVYGQDGRTRVAFRIAGLLCEIRLPPLDKSAIEASRSPRSWKSVEELIAAEERRRWRALLLIVKAKLEAAESGISTLEQEFFANVILRNGKLLIDELRPKLKALASDPNGPRLLEAGD